VTDESKRSTLAQVPFEGVCPAEVTTFLSLKLECESDPAEHHGILHYDVDQGIWWIHDDEMFEIARKTAGVTRYYGLTATVNPVAAAVAAERERISSLVGQWRTAGEHLASSNAAWSSHFYDCANELERLLGTEGDGDRD
jgi:hypothetical protein